MSKEEIAQVPATLEKPISIDEMKVLILQQPEASKDFIGKLILSLNPTLKPLNDVNDKESYNAVRNSWKKLKDFRIELEKFWDDKKQDALEWQRWANSQKSTLSELLKEEEQKYHKEWKFIDSEKKRIKEEAEAKALKKLNERIERITFNEGIVFDGQKYSFQGVSVSVEGLKSLDDKEFEMVVGDFQHAFNEECKRIAEEKRKKELQERFEKRISILVNELKCEREKNLSYHRGPYSIHTSEISNLSDFDFEAAIFNIREYHEKEVADFKEWQRQRAEEKKIEVVPNENIEKGTIEVIQPSEYVAPKQEPLFSSEDIDDPLEKDQPGEFYSEDEVSDNKEQEQLAIDLTKDKEKFVSYVKKTRDFINGELPVFQTFHYEEKNRIFLDLIRQTMENVMKSEK